MPYAIDEPRLAAPVREMRMAEDRIGDSSNLKSCRMHSAGDKDQQLKTVTPVMHAIQPSIPIASQKQPLLFGTMRSPASAVGPRISSNAASRPKNSATGSSHIASSKPVGGSGTEHQKNLYIGTTLTRPHSFVPWGLSVSLFDKAYLVLGSVNAVVGNLTSWISVTSHMPDPSTVFDPSSNQVEFYTAMNQLPSHPTSPRRLLPGDAILSVNGRTISSFDSLPAVTQYLRQTVHLSVLALRNEKALQEAHAVWTMKNDWSIPDRAFLASNAAYRALQRALHQDDVLSSSPIYPTSSSVPFSQMRAPHTTTGSRRSLLPLLYTATGDQVAVTNPKSSPVSGPSITDNFQLWLHHKKKVWKRGRRNLLPQLHASTEGRSATGMSPSASSKFTSSSFAYTGPTRWTNPLFHDENGNRLEYSDNDEFDAWDGTQANQFIVAVDSTSFPNWLAKRKETWRGKWKVYTLDDEVDLDENSDFWTAQGYLTFEHWLVESTSKWKRSYSWNQKKRKRIEQECEEIVHFPSTAQTCDLDTEAQLQQWLRVRKNQWRILRRKRQRREEETAELQMTQSGSNGDIPSTNGTKQQTLTKDDELVEMVTDGNEEPVQTEIRGTPRSAPKLKLGARSTSTDMIHIDALLEEQERRRRALDDRPPFDISFIFDAKLGAPDDAVAHCLSFLHPSEHGKLLCINPATSNAIKQRGHMWRQMCPTHWILPRRPRKPWHELYITKIRQEEEVSRKRSDDLLTKAAAILFKGGHLHKLEKLVNDGQKRFGFDINYVSGVVCERNSLLNLSVINGRDKIVRWLVETKGADLETNDRGNFTPLLNAAWDGNRYLVRLLLSKGCDRSKIGTGHYTQPLAPPDFKGLNAEGWARKRGHSDIANLIRMGLG